MLLIGIDEAGYGPLLGPLVVAGSAFRVPDPDAGGVADPDVAGALVRRALSGHGRGPSRLPVDDSKKVYTRGGLSLLERAPLALLASMVNRHDGSGGCPDTMDAFLELVGVDSAVRRRLPRYAGEPPRFPLGNDVADLEADGAAAAQRLAAVGAAFVGAVADVVLEDRLNEAFSWSGNKAATLFDVSCGVFERLRSRARPGEACCVVFDRHGGRKRYQPPLQGRYPDTFVWTLAESAKLSSYRVQGGSSGPFDAQFRVGADAAVPPVALGSMIAKYARELHMTLWNDWFATLCPDARPTAGYTQDGRRWLDETRTVREAAGVPDVDLVRIR